LHESASAPDKPASAPDKPASAPGAPKDDKANVVVAAQFSYSDDAAKPGPGNKFPREYIFRKDGSGPLDTNRAHPLPPTTPLSDPPPTRRRRRRSRRSCAECTNIKTAKPTTMF
jgi:hypothetical protein